MKKWLLAFGLAGVLAGAGVAWSAGFPNILTSFTTTQLVRLYYNNSPGSVQGYAALGTLASSGILKGALTGAYPTATTGSGTQTFTNSPCSTLTTAEWIPVTITGQTGTWYLAACQ